MLLWWSASAAAHSFRPAVLHLEETSAGHWRLQTHITPPATLSWPPTCEVAAPWITCAAPWPLRVDGLVGAEVVLRVRDQQGQERMALLTPEAPTYRGPEPEAFLSQVPRGVQALLAGPDPLAFLLGMSLVTRDRGAFAWTALAFVTAHTLSLFLGGMGWLTLPTAPLSATVALTIVWVARAAVRGGDRLSRAPWQMAVPLGLLHGLVSTSAFDRTGELRGLLGFQAGVGLTVVAFLGLLAGSAHALPAGWRGRRVLGYALGAVAMGWLMNRLGALCLG